ncbi:MAG: hypothetical protein K5988_00865, partial [Lachnospiraceae bacterium]|nr:hypothetical protein [Lachnospiraceae bacterium]
MQTAVSEIDSQVSALRNVMNAFEGVMEDAYLNEEINDNIKAEEEYVKGYSFFYLAPNGVLASSEENEYRGDIYSSLSKISSYYYTDNFVCLPAKNFFNETYMVDSIMGVKNLKDDEGNTYYLLVTRDLSKTLNEETFDYLDKTGCFIVIEGNGSVVASTESYKDYFKNTDNIYDALLAISSKSNRAQNQLNALKKNIFTKVNYSSKLEVESGD